MEEHLPKYGAMLFRGLPITTHEEFGKYMKGLGWRTLSDKDALKCMFARSMSSKNVNDMVCSAFIPKHRNCILGGDTFICFWLFDFGLLFLHFPTSHILAPKFSLCQKKVFLELASKSMHIFRIRVFLGGTLALFSMGEPGYGTRLGGGQIGGSTNFLREP